MKSAKSGVAGVAPNTGAKMKGNEHVVQIKPEAESNRYL